MVTLNPKTQTDSVSERFNVNFNKKKNEDLDTQNSHPYFLPQNQETIVYFSNNERAKSNTSFESENLTESEVHFQKYSKFFLKINL